MKLFDLPIASGPSYDMVIPYNQHKNFRHLIWFLQSCTTAKDADIPTSFKYAEKKMLKDKRCLVCTRDEFYSLMCWAIENEYCVKERDNYIFTDKAMNLFRKMIEFNVK